MPAKETIPKDWTIADLKGPAPKREEYVRRVVANFYASKVDRDKAIVRIGVQGRGISPHYRIEVPGPFEIEGTYLGELPSYYIFRGDNHETMEAFDVQALRDEHWSTKAMTFAEVLALFERLRARPRRA